MGKSLGKQALDQTAHFGQGIAVVLPWVWLPPLAAGPISAGVAMFWRELTQLRRSDDFKNPREGQTTWEAWHLTDRIVDIAFGTLGGLVVGVLATLL